MVKYVDRVFDLGFRSLINNKFFRSRLQRLVASHDEYVYSRVRKETSLRGVRIAWTISSPMDSYRSSSDSLEKKEPETLDWIDQYVKPGDVFFDIGANIGAYSLYAALRLAPKCRVYCFEPEFLNFSTLTHNILENRLSEIVTAYNVAISDVFAVDYLYCRFAESGQSGNQPLEALDSRGNNFDRVRVQGCVCISLDELVYKHGLECPNHVKIDTDGGELRIIMGAAQLLADPRLKSVLCEIGNVESRWRVIEEAFFRNGFRLMNSDFIDARRYSSRFTGANYIFAR